MELEEDQVLNELIQEFQQQFLCYKEVANNRFQELEGLIGEAAEKMEILQKRKFSRKKKDFFVNPFAKCDKTDRKPKELLHHLRLKFPRFTEISEAKEWLQEHYFEIFSVSENKVVAVAGMHLEGVAKSWYQTYVVGRRSWMWTEICEQFIARFGVWEQDLVFDNFKQLQQTTTVELYYGQFEKYRAHLMEKMPLLTEEFFVGSFIGGLKKTYRETLRLLNPLTVEQAYRLARECQEPMTEAKDNSSNRTGMFLRSGKLASIQKVQPEPSRNGEVMLLTHQQMEDGMKEGLCPYCAGKENPTRV